MEKIKNLLALHLCILVFSFTSVFSKSAALAYNAGGIYNFKFMLFAFLMLADCVLYAFFWQKVIRNIDLNVGYANRSVYLIWSQIWAVTIFNETLTTRNIIGLIVVFIGVLTVSYYSDYGKEA